jgi:hypothetical protein
MITEDSPGMEAVEAKVPAGEATGVSLEDLRAIIRDICK